MEIIQLLDLNAKFGSFLEEAQTLNLDYGFKHFSSIDQLDVNKHVVITDQILPHLNKIKNEVVYLWLMEPPSILPWVYELAYKNKERFKFIFSHNKKFCENIDICRWYPWGSYYIPLDQHKLYEKNKNVSIVASAKQYTEGHKFRHDVINKYKDLFDGIKCGDPVEPKIKWHDNYRYTVAIENRPIRGYFTEKIIDCFRTGTIPIYRGDSEINNYFDPNGIITFNTMEELEDILKICNEELYLNKIEAVKTNFEIAESYLYPWKIIKEKYL
jgi:hypothetical protein